MGTHVPCLRTRAQTGSVYRVRKGVCACARAPPPQFPRAPLPRLPRAQDGEYAKRPHVTREARNRAGCAREREGDVYHPLRAPLYAEWEDVRTVGVCGTEGLGGVQTEQGDPTQR